MTTDPFTEAARAEAEVQCGNSFDLEHFMAGAEWARDHLAAQEPTDAEVEAAARSLWAEGWLNPDLHPGDARATGCGRRWCRREARAPLSAPRAPRRAEGPPRPPCTRTRPAYTCPRPGSASAPPT